MELGTLTGPKKFFSKENVFLLHKQLRNFMKGFMTLTLAHSRAGCQLMRRSNV